MYVLTFMTNLDLFTLNEREVKTISLSDGFTGNLMSHFDSF